MAADVELLPCPFCGEGEHLLVEHLEGTILHPAHQIRCDNCGACSGYTDRDFRANWNTRATAAKMAGWIADGDTIPAYLIEAARDAIRLEFGNNGTDGYYKRILVRVFTALAQQEDKPCDS